MSQSFHHRPMSLRSILGLLLGGVAAVRQPVTLQPHIPFALRSAPNGGRPSGAAAAKRAARKRRNVRARASKRA